MSVKYWINSEGDVVMTDTQDVIQVVLSVYDPKGTYSRHAGVLMTSLFSKTSSPVCVTILHDTTLTEDNRARFQKTADVWDQKVRFIDVSEPILKIGSAEEIAKLTGPLTRGTLVRGALFRLLIPDLIEGKKVIYLDCDIVVNLDIAELWNVNIDKFSLAAFLQAPPLKKLIDKIRFWAMRLNKQKYFNSGVLVMNLDRIRQKYDLAEEAKSFFRRYRFCRRYCDQDILNMLFNGDALQINERFNSCGSHAAVNKAILHFSGAKPWYFPAFKRDYLYWKTLARSEWRDQLFDAVFEICRNGDYAHRHTKDCFKRICRQGWRNIWVHNNLFRVPAAYFLELYYRMEDFFARRKSEKGKNPRPL